MSLAAKRVLGFDGLDVVDGDVGFGQHHLGGWNDGHGHIALLGPCVAAGDHLDLEVGVRAELPGFLSGHDGDTAVAVRWVGLKRHGVDALGNCRAKIE